MSGFPAVRLTIRQACKHVYPFVHAKTIYLWIREGVFSPVVLVHSPSGPGGGTRLDFTDLVTVGVLHSLFQTGLLYRHLVENDEPTELRRASIFFYESTGRDAHLNYRQETESGWGRRLQHFLERHSYDLALYVKSFFELGHGSSKERKFRISISGPGGREPWWNVVEDEDAQSDFVVVGRSFIMARDWAVYVHKQLKLNL